jgi:hypothetical protein
MVAREQLERDERRSPAGRALVVEAPPEKLGLLAVAKLADRAVGDGALSVVLRARGVLNLVLPARAQPRERTLVAALGERGRLGSR